MSVNVTFSRIDELEDKHHKKQLSVSVTCSSTLL